jgi:ribose transport system permease protein
LGSGTSYQLSTIAAVVLGGTSIFGGKGGYGGTIAGVLITVLLLSILRVVGIPQAGQNIAYGVVILVMLVLFSARGRRRH